VDDVRAAAWLPLVVGLERAARLPRRALPAQFRGQRPAWEAAAEAIGDARYGRVGQRLARWRSPDPGLPLVKELLWALEQPEAAGYTRLALAGVTAVGVLVPGEDVRRGYVLAQSARAVRTLGSPEGALSRYVIAERLGQQAHDGWLCARAAVGLGTTHEYLGNYPSARSAFQRVLDHESVDSQLAAAAHHGLLIRAMTAADWDTALTEGWHLLQAGRSGSIPRAEVLNLLAELCHRIGRYSIAIRAAGAALRLAFRPDLTIAALAILVDVAVASRNRELGLRYGPLLRDHVGGSAGPFEDARALLALAGLEYIYGSREAANADLEHARAISDAHHYHELQFKAEKLAAVLTKGQTVGGVAEPAVCLNGQSELIVSKLYAWDTYDTSYASAAVR
jgi:tetratricopeptide (TPR) repeat protein